MMLGLIFLVRASSFSVTQIPATGYPSTTPLFSSLAATSTKLYTFGGQNNENYSNKLYQFDLTSKLWSPLLTSTHNLPVSRIHPIFVSFKGNLFLFGGQSQEGLLNDFWTYSTLSASWIQLNLLGSIPSPRCEMAFTLADKNLYIFGGATYDGADSSMFIIDLESLTSTFIASKDPPSGRSGASISYKAQTIYMWGGSVNDTSMYTLSLATSQWSTFSSLQFPASRQLYPSVLINDSIFIFPGLSFDMTESALICYRFSIKLMNFSEIQCNLDKIYFSFSFISNKMYLFAGNDEYGTNNDLLMVNISESIEIFRVVDGFTNPSARYGHSLTRSREFLWLFGGENEGEYFNDSWEYNLVKEVWNLIKTTSAPSGRSGHAITELEGDSFLIFGGKGMSGYLNDFYLYNFYANNWKALNPPQTPTARSDSCIAYNFPYVYLYGGINDSGVLNDFWIYSITNNTFNQQPISTAQLPPLFNHKCSVDVNGDLYIFSGETENSIQISSIYKLDTSSSEWSVFYSDPLLEISSSAIVSVDGTTIIVGGRRKFSVSNEVLIINNAGISKIGNFPIPLSSHAAVYAGNAVYVFGGRLSTGSIEFTASGTNHFFKVIAGEFPCGPGFYGSACNPCPMGFYNMKFNSNVCQACESGKYLPNFAATSVYQCLPCEKGTFAEEAGSFRCLICANKDDCPVGSTGPVFIESAPEGGMLQPGEFDNESSYADRVYFGVLYAVCGIICALIVIYIFFPDKTIFKTFDIYRQLHPRKYYEDPFSTTYGGLVSLIFISLAVLFTLTPIIYYIISNVKETKTLVPKLIMENKVFIAGWMTIEVILYNFGGVCANNNTCHNSISLFANKVYYSEGFGPVCISSNHSCSLSFTCKDCYVSQEGEIYILISGSVLYTTGIRLRVSSSSSIPDKNISRIEYYIEPPDGKAFSGQKPSIFDVLLIPSVFMSESSAWEGNTTGYHLTSNSDPIAGESVRVEEINSLNMLFIVAHFESSENVLLIERKISSTIMIALSSVLGSIAGLLTISGKVLNGTEKMFIAVKKSVDHKTKFKNLRKQRKKLEFNDEDNLEESTERVDKHSNAGNMTRVYA